MTITTGSTTSDPLLGLQRGIENIRERLVNTGLYLFSILLLFSFFLSIGRIFEQGWQLSDFLKLLGLGVLVAVSVISNKASQDFKAGLVLGMLLISGGYCLYFGRAGIEMVFLAVFCVLCTLFWGIRAGIAAVSACLLLFVITGFSVQMNWISTATPTPYLSSPYSWLTATVVFGTFLTLAIFGYGKIYSYFEETLKQLSQKIVELLSTKESLVSEVAERKRIDKVQGVLLEISRASNLSSNLGDLLIKVQGLLGQVLDTTNFFVSLYDESRDEYSFPFMADQYDDTRIFSREELKRSLTDYVRRTGTPLLLDEKALEQLGQQGEVDLVGTPSHSWLGVPLRTPRSVIGVVAIQSYEESVQYSSTDLNLLDMASGHIALAIERKRAEEALIQSELRFRRIFEEGPLGMALINLNSQFLRVNHVLSQMLGYTDAEFLDLDLIQISQAEESADNRQMLEDLLNQEIENFTIERRFLHKKGYQICTHFSASVVGDKVGKPLHILAMFEDITEQKKAEQEKQQLENQFRQAQKMEAVGLLAGGVAHDFNNILTGISWTAELALKEYGEEEKSPLPAFQQIRELSDRASVLTRQLLAFSRQQPINPVPVRANELIENTLRMLERLIGENITLQFAAHANSDQIEADPGQIEQVLMNLAINARDAMPRGGSLTIETRNETIRTRSELKFTKSNGAGSYVVIEIRDTGCGMDQETLDRIFEPFFTTKATGKGTGLGLSTVYGIVSQHGGHISADSVIGEGSVFTILLPCIEEVKETESHWISRPSENVPGGTETILLVEDEISLQQLMQRVLESDGYRVWVASNPKVVDETKIDAVDLLLTDMIMPRESGLELFERLQKIKPDLKVIFMSGYTNHEFLPGSKNLPFLQKPFSPRQLANTIRTILDS